ncbi:hypothetical protein B0H14DRAFT_3483525 [Mycena olivaceomarginata]|nr:hypothetical protein B0H14DRAFT_3483525 [Mycena olivaceomarginata]
MSNYIIDAHAFDTYYSTALLTTFWTCMQLLLFSILLVLLFNTTYLLHIQIRASRGWLAAATCAMGLFAIHRCYVIWGRNIQVIIVPALFLVVTAVIGFVGAAQPDGIGRSDHNDFRMVFGMIILTNLMLMALTAGHIWWIQRNVITLLEPSVTRTYDTVIAMILESGTIYCISLLLYLIAVVRLNKQDFFPAISVF